MNAPPYSSKNYILWSFSILIFLECSFFNTLSGQVSYEVQFTHDGKIVHGTFSAPSANGKFPTIIIAPGSGPNDRNGTLTLADSTSACLYPELVNATLQPYKQLSDALVDSGYAVLRYDKLEYTYTPAQLGTITFHKLWLPVESAINYIKTRSDVDTNCITLLGHSEGSLLIPYIARNRSDVNALISIAGPRTPFDSILAYQVVNIAKTCDDDTITAQFQADQILEYFHLVRVNHGVGLPAAFGVPGTVWYDYLVATEAVSNNYNSDNLPTLFVGFGRDINVPPSELERLQQEVTITDDFWSLPDIIHYMNPYNEPQVSQDLTDTIVNWLKQTCFTSAVSDAINDDQDITAFPNPFYDEVNVELANASRTLNDVSIQDGLGRPVIIPAFNFNGSTITMAGLSGLSPGVYYLVLKFENKVAVSTIFKW